MKDADALAAAAAALPAGIALTKLWSLTMPLPDEVQKVWLFSGVVDDVFTVVAVGERHPPLALPLPDWEQARRSRREREHDVLMLYVGWLIWQRRAPDVSAAMNAAAEKARLKAAKHPQSAGVDVVEVLSVKGLGGTHVTLRRTLSSGRVEFTNQSGRVIGSDSLSLKANVEHATWRFLALEFLPRRGFQRQGWPLA